jgi:hypothetical protein
LNDILILCEDKYEAQKLSGFIFSKDGKELFISEILNVVDNEIVISLKDKSAHSVLLKDDHQVEAFVDFIQSVIENEHKILKLDVLENSVKLTKG